MIAAADINITKVERSKLTGINLENIPFGKYFTDHMLEADYEDGEWKNVEIKPYQPLLLSPSLAVLHYGQSIFEGMKAYKNQKGEPYLFRPFDNFKRFNISAERMAMPQISEEIFVEGLRQLVDLDKNWVPNQPKFFGTNLELQMLEAGYYLYSYINYILFFSFLCTNLLI